MATWSAASGLVATTAGVTVEGDRRTAATAGVAVAAPEAVAAGSHARLEGCRAGGVDGHCGAHVAVGGHLEGEGNVRAVVECVPRALAVAGRLGCTIGDAGTAFETADGHDVAAGDVELIAALGVGIDTNFWLCFGNGEDVAALDVHVAVGIQSVIAAGVGHDVAAADGHVARRVDGVVARVGVDVAAADVEGRLGLDGLMVGGADVDAAARDGHGAVGLDALGRCLQGVVQPFGGAGRGGRPDGCIAGARAVGYLASGGDADVGCVADGERAVHLDALAARTRAGQGQRAAADGHVAVGTQTLAALHLLVVAVPRGIAGRLNGDVAAADLHVACTLHTLRGSCRDGDVERAALQIDVARVFILVVSGLAGRRGTVQVALDAVVANARDGHRARLHLEVFVARDAVADSAGDVQRQVLDGDVVATLNGMLGVAHDVQHAVALQLYLSLRVDAAFLRTARAVGQRIGGVLLSRELDALAVGDVDGCTAGVGQRHTGQRDRTLVGAGERKLAVGSGAAELVGNLVAVDSVGIALGNADVGTADGRLHILGYVACYGDCCRRAVVGDGNLIVGHLAFVGVHAGDVGDGERLAHNGQGDAAREVHLARLRGGELVGDVAHLDVQRLCRCCHRCQRGDKG